MTARLVLFDIDLTLVHFPGMGPHTMGRAFARYAASLGVDRPPEAVVSPPHAGKTDPLLFREMCALNGLPHSEDGGRTFLSLYLDELDVALPAWTAEGRARLLPGVRDALAAVRAAGARVGLVSGNVRAGARAKLAAFDLWDELGAVGAFGDDAEQRERLPPLALDRARAVYNEPFDPARTLIVGDALQDVACGAASGCPVLGVGTGGLSAETMIAAGARAFVPDLTHTDGLLAALYAAGGAP